MSDREELQALRRLAELEDKAAGRVSALSGQSSSKAESGPSIGDAIKEKAAQFGAGFATGGPVGAVTAMLGEDGQRQAGEGALTGAATIGNTVLSGIRKVPGSPLWLLDKAAPKQTTVKTLVTGKQSRPDNVAGDVASYLDSVPAAIKASDEANKDSLLYKGSKLGAQIAMTAPVGGAIAEGASAIPVLARNVPNLINAIRSGGMVAGQPAPGVLPAATNMLTRMTGGAITGGASAGLIDPEQAGGAAIVGGAFPLVTAAAGKTGSVVGGLIRGTVEPFTKSGPQTIAGRTLLRFGVTPEDVAGLTSAPTATGARTTLAEQISRPEGAAAAAGLQDSLRSLDPEIAARMASREIENNAARVNVLRGLSGADGGRAAAIENRSNVAGDLYREAFGANRALSPSQLLAQKKLIEGGGIDKLIQSPAIQAAMKEAQANAANAGKTMTADGSIEGLHNMKLAIDDMIKDPATAAQANKVAALKSARDRLISVIETLSPAYKDARTTYAQMSRPVNQMDVIGEALRRGTSNTSDLAGNPRLMPNALLGSLGNEGTLIRQATGRRDIGSSLSSLLEPDQLQKLRAVADEVDRAAAVSRAANGPGSATAKRLASTNLLQQMGVPANALENPLIQTIMRPVQFGAKMAEPKIQNALLDIVQNPSLAEEAMRMASPAQKQELQRIISGLSRVGYQAAPVLTADR